MRAKTILKSILIVVVLVAAFWGGMYTSNLHWSHVMTNTIFLTSLAEAQFYQLGIERIDEKDAETFKNKLFVRLSGNITTLDSLLPEVDESMKSKAVEILSRIAKYRDDHPSPDQETHHYSYIKRILAKY